MPVYRGDDVYIAEQEKALKALAELTELRAVHERCGADALQMRSALSRVEFELAELKSAYQRLETSFIASQDAHSKAMHQAKTRESGKACTFFAFELMTIIFDLRVCTLALISRETELLKRSAVVLEERSELQKFNVSLKQSLADTRSQLLILQTNAASVSGALTIAQDAALARALEAEAAAKLVVDLQARITAFTSALELKDGELIAGRQRADALFKALTTAETALVVSQRALEVERAAMLAGTQERKFESRRRVLVSVLKHTQNLPIWTSFRKWRLYVGVACLTQFLL
jgi:hypothetical protein